MTKEKWTANNIADQTGKTAIITGSNTGLGKETATVLAGKNATVIIAVRNMEKGERAAGEIKQIHSSAKVKVMELDLSSLKSIKAFVANFKKEHKELHLLINNAGVMMPPFTKTNDGFELQFGTNHLGHFALTGQLLPLLKETTDSRIVTVASSAHNWGNLDLNDLQWEQRKYKSHLAYGDSKIANLYFTYELSRKLKDTAIKVTAAHPGWTATNLQKNSKVFMFFNPLFAQKPEMGALPTLRAATDPQAQSSDYYGPQGYKELKGHPTKVQSNDLSKNKQIAQKLWTISEELTGIKY